MHFWLLNYAKVVLLATNKNYTFNPLTLQNIAKRKTKINNFGPTSLKKTAFVATVSFKQITILSHCF